jgi:hypothetical protein
MRKRMLQLVTVTVIMCNGRAANLLLLDEKMIDRHNYLINYWFI